MRRNSKGGKGHLRSEIGLKERFKSVPNLFKFGPSKKISSSNSELSANDEFTIMVMSNTPLLKRNHPVHSSKWLIQQSCQGK